MAFCNDVHTAHHFDYYDAKGIKLAESHGEKIEETLFKQAHYVVRDQSHMLKNLDSHQTIQRDIEAFRQEILATPLSNMAAIVEINNAMRALTEFLDQQATA